MFLGKVRGNVVSSVKNEYLNSHKLLLVREIDPEGKFLSKTDFISLDLIDSGIGDTVLVTREGDAVQQILGNNKTPVNTIIVAIVDDIEIQQS